MNFESIITQLGVIFLEFLTIIASYYFCKWYIPNKRKDEELKATIWEKVFIIIATIGISCIIGAFLSKGELNNRFIVYWSMIGIPALIGTIRAYEIDAKLTPLQRQLLREKIQKEEYDNRNSRDAEF